MPVFWTEFNVQGTHSLISSCSKLTPTPQQHRPSTAAFKPLKAVSKVGHSTHCRNSCGTHPRLLWTSLYFSGNVTSTHLVVTSEYFKPCQPFLLVIRVALISFEMSCRAWVEQKWGASCLAEGHLLVGKKHGQAEGLESWRPGEGTEGKAARLEAAVRKQVRKKNLLLPLDSCALCNWTYRQPEGADGRCLARMEGDLILLCTEETY